MIASMTMEAAVEMYRIGNQAGEGYAPGPESVDQAVEIEVLMGGSLLLPRCSSEDVAVVATCLGRLVAIGGDAVGGQAWAVEIGEVES